VCNIFLIVSSLLVTTVLCAPAQQASQPLTLQDCIRLAESVPSTVGIAREEREIAAREVSRVRPGIYRNRIWRTALPITARCFTLAPLPAK
jgi:hypothetical protein